MSQPLVRLQNYVLDRMVEGVDGFSPLHDPATEAVVAEASTRGVDMAAVLHHARAVGGPALRAMTFAERGELLKSWSRALHKERERLLDVAMVNGGNSRSDAKFDFDGATFTLSAYARLGQELGDRRFLVDGELVAIGSGARFVGAHVRVPLRGAAVHINAFNFPAWGAFEKAATAVLAGMPVVTKPATSTAWLTWEMVRVLVEQALVPPGVLQLLCGSAGDLLEHVTGQDVVAFTGSADTAASLRAGVGPTRRSTRFNAEADSLNALVLGPDVGPGDAVWDAAVRNLVTEVTQKAGQKCTAIRRAFVPADRLDDLQEALVDGLGRVPWGNPAHEGVRMGPLTTAAQLRDFHRGVELLRGVAPAVWTAGAPLGAPEGRGWYAPATVLRAEGLAEGSPVHEHEVFGPCVTLLPYDGSAAEAARGVALGKGSLVSSLFSADREFLAELVLEAAPYNGRLLVVDDKVADQATGHGMVLPDLVHGGPGRAGGGEELGGVRGMGLYLQRTAVQGNKGLLKRVLGVEG